jgi:MFS family permease
MRVLRHRDFRLLFIGQSASQIGTQAVIVAMALYITRRTGSATDLSVILGAGSLPFVALIVFGGVWADRLPRHRVVIASDSTRALLHATLGVLILTGAPAIWLIALIEAASGVAEAFFQPAYVGLVPQTVPESEIQSAQALRGTLENASIVIGPLLATAVVLTLGAGEAFLFDAASFALGAALLWPVRPRRRGRAGGGAPAGAVQSREARGAGASASFITDLKAGYREVRSRSWLWVTIIAYTAVTLCTVVPLMGLGPLAVRDAYGSVGLFGLLIAIYGAGSLVASLLATVLHPRRPLRLALALGALWPLIGLLVALGLPRTVLFAGALISGGSGALTGVWWETTLAHHIPPRALSRVSAWDHMGSLALMPLGYAAVGPLAAGVGVRWVLGVGAAVGMLSALGALIPRSARRLPARAETGPPASGPAAPGVGAQPNSSRASAA